MVATFSWALVLQSVLEESLAKNRRTFRSSMFGVAVAKAGIGPKPGGCPIQRSEEALFVSRSLARGAVGSGLQQEWLLNSSAMLPRGAASPLLESCDSADNLWVTWLPMNLFAFSFCRTDGSVWFWAKLRITLWSPVRSSSFPEERCKAVRWTAA